MKHDQQWYLDWTPGDPEYPRDDTLLAIGLKCAATPYPLRDVLAWLGTPDKVDGNAHRGHLAYYFDSQQESAALFDVIDERVCHFGTVTRTEHNAVRDAGEPGEKEYFNILDEMDEYAGSEME